MSRVYALSIHADYRCRHSGACCSSDWDVPVEAAVYRTLDEALRHGRVAPAGVSHDGSPPLIVEEELPDEAAAMLARTTEGRCVFHDPSSGLCVVHRDAGETALPMTCRHFPRLAVRDRRGTHVSLTHYCPTAAALLFRDMPLEIVADPEAFPPAEYEGLVVDDDAWPPLLNSRTLMDDAGYAAWERHMVTRCAGEGRQPEAVVATLLRDAALLQDFDPARGDLRAHIDRLPHDVVEATAPETLAESLEHFGAVMAAVPDALRPDADENGLGEAYVRFARSDWPLWHAPLRRYLAAKAFANWTAYQGRGVTAIVTGLDAALAVVRVEASRRCRDAGRALDADILREAVRAADYALNHLAVGEDLAEAWSRPDRLAPAGSA